MRMTKAWRVGVLGGALVCAAAGARGQDRPVPSADPPPSTLEEASRGPSITLPAVLGQPLQPAPPEPTPHHTGIHAMIRELGEDFKHLPSTENLMWAGIGGGLALAVHPADTRVNRAVVGSAAAKNVFRAGEPLGELPALLGTAGAIYIIGRAKDEPRVSHVGMDLIRALAMSELLTQAVKYSTRRQRPDGSSRNSFPSGHAADTFAFATALERHLNWKLFVPAYIFSSYVALSRLPANRHWLSDAVFGSAIGVIAGRTVTGHELNKYNVQVTPVPGGVFVMYVHTTR